MSTISRMTLVQIVGESGGKPTVRPWSPSASEKPALLTSPKVLGVALTDADDATQVAVMRRGYARSVAMQNGETWSALDLLWAKNDGTVTHTRPIAPLPLVRVGTVVAVSSSLCLIDVEVAPIPAITELSGVLVDEPADKDVLTYVSANSRYETKQLDHGDLGGLSTAGAHPGAAISNTPAGNIAATTVQAAINELDSEKAAASHTHAESDVTGLVTALGTKVQVGGQIGGTITSPTVTGLTETTGPTALALGAVADGQYLKRVGATVVGAAGGSGASTLHDLTDVDDTGKANTNVLAWDSGASRWKPAAAAAGSSDLVGDSGSGGTHGLAPAPAAGDAAAGKYLKADGTWHTPPTGGGGGTVHHSRTFAMAYPPLGNSEWPIFVAPVAMTLTKISSIIIGTGGGTMDMTVDATEQLSPDQTLATSWTASAALSTAVAAGKALTVKLKGIAGTVSYVVVQVDLTEAL